MYANETVNQINQGLEQGIVSPQEVEASATNKSIPEAPAPTNP